MEIFPNRISNQVWFENSMHTYLLTVAMIYPTVMDFMPQLWSKSQEGDMCWEQKPDETPQFEHQENHTGIYSPLHKSGSDRMDVTV